MGQQRQSCSSPNARGGSGHQHGTQLGRMLRVDLLQTAVERKAREDGGRCHEQSPAQGVRHGFTVIQVIHRSIHREHRYTVKARGFSRPAPPTYKGAERVTAVDASRGWRLHWRSWRVVGWPLVARHRAHTREKLRRTRTDGRRSLPSSSFGSCWNLAPTITGCGSKTRGGRRPRATGRWVAVRQATDSHGCKRT